jgi:hypothetical protein
MHSYVEGCVPWEDITIFVNTLGRSGVVEARFEGTEFPQQMSGTGRQLPEDFVMRGLIWAQHYFPADFFNGQVVGDDERSLECFHMGIYTGLVMVEKKCVEVDEKAYHLYA